MENINISVCIATYNRAVFLPKAIEAVLNQTYSKFELLIVDDCSTDHTQNICQTIKDPRVRIFKHDINKGLAAARNTALFNARGRYFTFIDDDDRWLPNTLEMFVKCAEDHEKHTCFICGKLAGKIEVIPRTCKTKLKNYIYKGFTPPVGAQFYHRTDLIAIKGYNEQIKSGVDHDLWLRLIQLDISIQTIPFAGVIPNANQGMDRITTNPEKRIKKIQESLHIWRQEYTHILSSHFFDYFEKAYLHYLNQGFFESALFQKNVSKAISHLKNDPMPMLSIIHFTKLVAKILFRKIFRIKEIILSPSFISYRD